MDDDQQFCLRWNNHQSTLISVFDTLLENETLVDCTLAAEGKFLKAHKVVLSACSPYFAALLQEQYDKHPIFILKDVKYQELRAMMDYMYRGEVNISQDQLAALLKAAESLQIKGLSDNRSGSGSGVSKPEHHRPMGVPVGGGAGGLGGSGKPPGAYTLENTKRARVGPSSMDSQSGSREGSSSPSRRRRKARRRSIENAMADVHDNSNSSQIQAQQSSLLQQQQQQQQQQQSNANLAGVGAITAAASALASQGLPAGAMSTGSGVGGVGAGATAASLAAAVASAQGTTQQQLTTSVTKKTESVKGTSDAMITDNLQASSSSLGGVGAGDEQQEMIVAAHHGVTAVKADKQNHKQKGSAGVASKDIGGSEMVIEPKSEFDDEGNDETVEDLTLDEEDIGMDDLDQNAGTSQGAEGSSQGYAAWQHERSQDELLLGAQEAQQRDPQVKHDKSEQTDITPEEFELDDCLLESNDIVITQNKDGFVLHVKKLGNITTAKISSPEDEQSAGSTVTSSVGHAHITEVQDVVDVKPMLTTLTSSPIIKLPSTECELINLKKIIPQSTTISTHQPQVTTTIIQPQQLHHHQQHQPQQQPHQQHQQLETHQPEPQHQHHIPQHHPQVQSIVTTHAPQSLNLMALRNVQITEQKPIVSRIKYSRGKIITPQGAATANVQIVQQPHDPQQHQLQHELTEGTKYEISEIDLNNPTTSAAIISDLVKYAEIDDIELPDGTKIGIGFAPTEITEHMQSASTAQITSVETTHPATVVQHHQHQQHQHQQHHQHHQTLQLQTHHEHQQLELHEQDDTEETTIIPDTISVQEHQQAITKSYTILTSRPIKQEGMGPDGGTTTTYELSLSDSSMGQPDDGESRYVCRHCGKKYRWKSTLRRHENVECGGKEPCHPCPYCSYKAKQRGNLGVHVRKHHPDKPQLVSKRGRKF